MTGSQEAPKSIGFEFDEELERELFQTVVDATESLARVCDLLASAAQGKFHQRFERISTGLRTEAEQIRDEAEERGLVINEREPQTPHGENFAENNSDPH